jgi:hypothetical protein
MRLATLTVAIAGLALAGCSERSAATVKVSVVDACPGGKVRPVCRSRQDQCVTPYVDAGKSCSSSSQCKGKCIVDLTVHCDALGNCTSRNPPETGARILGTCQVDNDPCGAFILVENGVAQAPVHVD